MTKAFVADVLQRSCDLSGAKATEATNDLIRNIVVQMKRDGRFMLPGFGTFTVVPKKARTALNPRTLEKVKVKAGKTVRFKASPVLKKTVGATSGRRAATTASTRRQNSHTGASA